MNISFYQTHLYWRSSYHLPTTENTCWNLLYRTIFMKFVTSGVTGGGAEGQAGRGAEISDREISADPDLLGKNRQGKKGKWCKKKENCKSKGEKLKMEGGKVRK